MRYLCPKCRVELNAEQDCPWCYRMAVPEAHWSQLDRMRKALEQALRYTGNGFPASDTSTLANLSRAIEEALKGISLWF